MNVDDVLKFCGLLFKAKKVVIGEDVISYANKGKIHLLLLADDISDNSMDFYSNKIKNFTNISKIVLTNKVNIGRSLGKGNVVIIGILDEKASNKIVMNFN